MAPLDPWLAIAAAVYRGQPGDESWHPEQAITIAEAIAASADGRRIAVGEPGDVALLDYDPLTSDAAGLTGMRVALTAVAGQVVRSDTDAHLSQPQPPVTSRKSQSPAASRNHSRPATPCRP